ncbi:MAG: homoserine dehydrogenase [Anaerolineae bacterium]|nr:homoserine dehydrogenase [Anaerolineae bacterium]
MNLNVALVGFGNVGRSLAEILLAKQDFLRSEFHAVVRVVGISTGRHGHAIAPSGISLRTALDAVRFGSQLDGLHEGRPVQDTSSFLERCPADLVFESLPTNPIDGQPALDHIRGLLERGVHVVTANKGPVAYGYHELKALADKYQVGFFFEATVMDGAPVIGVGREGLVGTDISEIRGIFNSTTNYILTQMEYENLSFDEAVRMAQEIGIAETDPSLDVDGWDSVLKLVIMSNLLMGIDLRPEDVAREGIQGITLDDILAAIAAGQRIKLVCKSARRPDGSVESIVAPQRLSLNDPFAAVMGTSSVIDYVTDTLPQLTIIENNPSPMTTAYGMFVDMLNIVRGRHVTGSFEPIKHP